MIVFSDISDMLHVLSFRLNAMGQNTILAHGIQGKRQNMQHVRDILELIHSKNFLKISNLETSLLLLKLQTFVVVYNIVFILA